MKIIYKSFILDKSILRQLFILVLLLVILNLSGSFKMFVDRSIYLENNSLGNRTIEVIFNDGYKIEGIANDIIESVEKLENNKYKITFKEYTNVTYFSKHYQEYYSNITLFNQNDNSGNLLTFLQVFLNIVNIITFILTLVIIFINIIEIFINMNSEVSLYKLMGFTSFTIFEYFALVLFSVYILLFISSILIYWLSIILLNIFISTIYLNFVSASFILNIFVAILILILVLVIVLYFKIRKVTPISFQKNND